MAIGSESPALDGVLRIVAKAVKTGRTTGLVRAEIFNHGKLAATGDLSVFIPTRSQRRQKSISARDRDISKSLPGKVRQTLSPGGLSVGIGRFIYQRRTTI